MDQFNFSIPQNIIFGKGSLNRLPELALKLKKSKGYIISGPHLNKIGLVEKCREALKTAGIESEAFTETEGNPSTETVEKAAAGFEKSGADFIVAFGGGSPLDVAKAVAIVAMYGGKITDYEGGGKVPGPVVPMIAIPTTAGTGSEVTAFSVITDHSRNYKLTVVSNDLLPAYAILDPELIASVPAKTAAACGVDAMVHALEAFLSKAASTFSDMFAEKALEMIGRSIRTYVAKCAGKACSDALTDKAAADTTAQENEVACVSSQNESADDMMCGSLFAGIAFSHARLGDVHAMSHPVSAFFDVPHGVANAILLPTIVEFNAPEDHGKYYRIYRCIAKAPVSESEFTAEMLVNELRKLNEELGIPATLREVGVTEDKFEVMSVDAMKSGNIAVNPRTTTREDVVELYKKAF